MSGSSSSGVGDTSIGKIDLLPLWIVVVPIVVLNILIAGYGAHRHRKKYLGEVSAEAGATSTADGRSEKKSEGKHSSRQGHDESRQNTVVAADEDDL